MRQFTGEVVKTKMDKTVVVFVKRIWQHPIYKKRVRRGKRFLVDDQIGVKVGNQVIIEECRPISKRKRFKVIKVIKKEK